MEKSTTNLPENDQRQIDDPNQSFCSQFYPPTSSHTNIATFTAKLFRVCEQRRWIPPSLFTNTEQFCSKRDFTTKHHKRDPLSELLHHLLVLPVDPTTNREQKRFFVPRTTTNLLHSSSQTQTYRRTMKQISCKLHRSPPPRHDLPTNCTQKTKPVPSSTLRSSRATTHDTRRPQSSSRPARRNQSD